MIELDERHLIGRGRTRLCYVHPLEPDKCIKIDKRASGGATEKEARYYGKLARIRPGISYSHIPRFHGFVETNLGKGGVFDLIRNETDGDVSKSLNYHIHKGEVAADDPRWLDAHRQYMKTLYDEAVIIRDFNPGNICVRRLNDGSLGFVTIDGIGHRDFLPLCDYFPKLARRKLRRQVKRKNFDSLAGIIERAVALLQEQRTAASKDST